MVREGDLAFTAMVFGSAAVVLRIGGMCGRCTGRLTLSKIDVSIRHKAVFNLLKPGNTNGAALVHVVGNVATPSENRILLGNGPLDLDSSTHVNCLPRRHKLCGGVGINRRTVCLYQLGKLSGCSTRGQLGC